MELTKTEKTNRYKMEYAKKNYKRIPLDVTFSKYDEIKAAASAAGLSVNGFIKSAIDEKLQSDQ